MKERANDQEASMWTSAGIGEKKYIFVIEPLSRSRPTCQHEKVWKRHSIQKKHAPHWLKIFINKYVALLSSSDPTPLLFIASHQATRCLHLLQQRSSAVFKKETDNFGVNFQCQAWCNAMASPIDTMAIFFWDWLCVSDSQPPPLSILW